MAITITQDRKKQRYLLLALAAIIFAVLLVVWLGFFGKKGGTPQLSSSPVAVYAVPKIEIDWQALDNLRAESLKPFEEITPLKGDLGRKNPFTPY
ncbi:MAG: hypothetical protein HYT20_00945 [Candidatus Nealsonbacteria bacterium]|nr:hypothetical protein [Candidatus Nealsonbacteria bacterium]